MQRYPSCRETPTSRRLVIQGGFKISFRLDSAFKLVEMAPGVTADQVRERTTANYES